MRRVNGTIAAALGVGAVLVICIMAPASAQAARLQLAAGGTTEYSIVIGAEAAAAERLAAEELALFLGRMTGADFPVVHANVGAASGPEIILGRTARNDDRELPEHLRPELSEGFAIVPRDDDLIIIGNTPRGTLYGVYDFLEQDLGVRFLAPDATHVPLQPTLAVDVTERVYEPPLEYRNIYDDARWCVRNRLNATWSWVPMEGELGGVRFIGPSFVHTFKHLLPPDRYFDEHPEYFALVDGRRLRTAGGSSRPAQLCLTHPDVLRIATGRVREWVGAYQADEDVYHPGTRMIASVSANDAGGHCQCARCAAVNEDEGSTAGTLIRFVNQVAGALEADYPDLAIETLAYGATETPPRVTHPRDNVIVRLAPIGADFGSPLDDPDSAPNRSAYQNLRAWSRICDRLYVWTYVCNFHAYFKPFPNLEHLDRDIRTWVRNGVRGLYAQSSHTPGSELRAVRHYLLARCMWRPETDARQAMKEFCRLYYGRGGDGVLAYIDYLHDYFRRQGKPLHWNDASRADGIVYDDEFIARANEMLAEAESAARTPSRRRRVATVRLSIWYLMLQRALGHAARGERPAKAAQEAARRFMAVSREAGVMRMSESYGPPGQQLRQQFFPRLRSLLRLSASEGEPPAPGVHRGVAAFFGNPHRTYSVTADETALSGSCVCQAANQRWTLGQAVRWGITEQVSAAHDAGERYRLRARVKAETRGDEGPAFRFGYMSLNRDWSSSICAAMTVSAAEVEDGQWRWFTLPEPVEYVPAERGQNAFVVAAENPDAVEHVCVDCFELVPVQ